MQYRFSVLTLAAALGVCALPSVAHAQWTQVQQVNASDAYHYDNFGSVMAVSGNTLVVGAATVDTNNGPDTGAAYVFVHDGTNWVQKQKLTASDGAQYDNFGAAVAIDGNLIVIGAYRAN